MTCPTLVVQGDKAYGALVSAGTIPPEFAELKTIGARVILTRRQSGEGYIWLKEPVTRRPTSGRT